MKVKPHFSDNSKKLAVTFSKPTLIMVIREKKKRVGQGWN